MEAGRVSVKTFTLSLAVVLAVETGFRLAIVRYPGWSSSLAALGSIRFIESILLVIIAIGLERSPGPIGLAPSDLSRGFIKGLIWSASFGLIVGLLFIVLLVFGVNGLKLIHGMAPSSPGQMVILLLIGGIVGPVAEEVFFRGIVYGFLRQWGVIFAVVSSTLIFVFFHSTGTSIPVTQAVGGVLFALAYEKEKSLITPITIHCLGNLAIFCLPLLLN